MDTRRTNDVFGIRVVKKCKNCMHKMIFKKCPLGFPQSGECEMAFKCKKKKKITNKVSLCSRKGDKVPSRSPYSEENVIKCPLSV